MIKKFLSHKKVGEITKWLWTLVLFMFFGWMFFDAIASMGG